MNLVFFYGPPGVGKLTVAKALAELTEFKLFDNHTRFDFTKRLFDFNTERFWRMESRLSSLVLEEAIDAEISLVSTFIAPNPGVMGFLQPFLDTLQLKEGHACFVDLSCERSIHEERVQAPGRAEAGKLTSLGAFQRIMETYDATLSPGDYPLLRIDITHLAPTEAARQIAEHYGLATV